MKSQNQSQPYRLILEPHKITYINVGNGRKIIPGIGHSQLPPRAALNMFRGSIQMNSIPYHGEKSKQHKLTRRFIILLEIVSDMFNSCG
jgi:hypothetical protein